MLRWLLRTRSVHQNKTSNDNAPWKVWQDSNWQSTSAQQKEWLLFISFFWNKSYKSRYRQWSGTLAKVLRLLTRLQQNQHFETRNTFFVMKGLSARSCKASSHVDCSITLTSLLWPRPTSLIFVLQLPYSDDLLVPCFPTLLYAQHLGTTFVAFSWRCDIFCIYGFYNECHHNWWYRRSWIFLHNPHTLAVGFGVGFGISIKVALYRSRFLKQTRSNIKAPNMQPTHTHTLIQLEDSTIISVASVLFSTTWSPPPSPPPSPPEPEASPAMVTTISLS